METIVEILIDNSGSMGPFEVEKNNGQYLLPDRSTRMSLAKKILITEVLPTLEYAKKISVRLFHSVAEKEIEKLEITPIYDSVYDQEKIARVIEEIADPIKTGGTPLTAAIKYSINILSKQPNADRKIFLITDGEENVGGNYAEAAKEALALHGIPCNIFVLGIALTATAETKVNKLANDTNGWALNLPSSNYDQNAIKAQLRSINKEMVSSSIRNITAETEPLVVKSTQDLPTIQTEHIVLPDLTSIAESRPIEGHL